MLLLKLLYFLPKRFVRTYDEKTISKTCDDQRIFDYNNFKHMHSIMVIL